MRTGRRSQPADGGACVVQQPKLRGGGLGWSPKAIAPAFPTPPLQAQSQQPVQPPPVQPPPLQPPPLQADILSMFAQPGFPPQ